MKKLLIEHFYIVWPNQHLDCPNQHIDCKFFFSSYSFIFLAGHGFLKISQLEEFSLKRFFKYSENSFHVQQSGNNNRALDLSTFLLFFVNTCPLFLYFLWPCNLIVSKALDNRHNLHMGNTTLSPLARLRSWID